MKDLHSHILYDIDDGARSLEESLEILKKAFNNGVTDIVLTPHYIKDSMYDVNNQEKIKKLKKLQEELKRNKIDINLYLGNEVYVDDEIVELIENDYIKTINDSRYVLIELPLNSKYSMLEEVLFKLKKKNLVPIIAHPERYICYYNDYDFFDNLIKSGCLFQCNIGSLYGYYGTKSKRMLKGFLKRRMVHFFGSDIHHAASDIYEKDIRKTLFKILKDEEKVDRLLNKNIELVLKNKELIINYQEVR